MSNLSLSRKMSKKQRFMDLQLPCSTIPISTKKSPGLLEPIKHDDEVTIKRLISIHHTRSFTMGYDEQEEKIYAQKRDEIINCIEKFSDDEENINYDKTRKNTYTLPTHTIHNHTHSQSISHIDNIEMDAMHRVLNEHKSYSNDDDDDTESTKNNILTITIPLHTKNKLAHKIQREKTPLPSDRKKNKIKKKQQHSDHKINIKCTKQKHYDKALKFKSISGNLEKKSASKFVGWQTRWFYLWKDKLDYYKESSLQIRGSISLWNVDAVGVVNEYNMGLTANGVPTVQKNKHHKLNKFTFQIVIEHGPNVSNSGRVYYIRTKDMSMRDEWIEALNNNLKVLSCINGVGDDGKLLSRDRNSSKYKKDKSIRSRSIGCVKKHVMGSQLQRTRVRNKSVPFNMVNMQESITFLDICKYSNTGDVLLFDTKSKSGACVRVATGGNYDHIGMIFRLRDGKVGVLEALGSGVQVFLWRNFRKYNWDKQYSRIAFRSLMIPDGNLRKEIKRKLTLFVKTVVNRHYGWNPIQLIRKQSSVSLYDESRTFFCSELIAKAFKEAGLLRGDFASSQYFPSHFQESKHLTLLKGCWFSNEMNVTWTYNGDNKKKQGTKQRAKTTGIAPNIEIVSLNRSNNKKQKLKSPPPRQLF